MCHWDNFIAHSQNKADLARFLSQQLMIQAPSNKTIVVAGGFSNELQVESSTHDVNTEDLEAWHEEADTVLERYFIALGAKHLASLLLLVAPM